MLFEKSLFPMSRREAHRRSGSAAGGGGGAGRRAGIAAVLACLAAGGTLAGVGDPQTRTDHPWFPGELSCSTFDRLFRTEAELYTRVTGRKVDNDEDKALAAWYWRNLNYWHCELVGENIGSSEGDRLNREYWGGLFGYGFGLCFDTHHQFSGEIWELLGPNRCRTAGVEGHTSFEVHLKGGAYGDGHWVLLDHDVSTVVFLPDGSRLAGLTEISRDMTLLKNGSRARGWLPSGLHPSDGGAYRSFKWVGYSTGYAGAPAIVNLRAGETLRRYPAPGLEDGGTFLYWGVNHNIGGIPGPARDLTWALHPEAMYQATRSVPGNKVIRHGNAIYIYKPDFRKGTYKEGVVAEDDGQVTFEWYSPYVIAATPPAAAAREKKGVLQPGCTGGLVIRGRLDCPVEVSVDQGASWTKAAETKDGMDLTDLVKGCHQYLLRFNAGAKALADSGLVIVTGCQSSPTIIPHVKSGRNTVTYEATGRGFISAGPNKGQAAARVVAGAMGTPEVTLRLEAPRGAPATAVHAAAHVACGSPPREAIYNIDCSIDDGRTWQPVLKDYQVKRIPPEPGDWWSQALMQGRAALANARGPVLVRFANTGGRSFMRVEAQLLHVVPNTSLLRVTYAWKENGVVRHATRTYSAGTACDASWSFDAGAAPETFYVEYAAE
jgi:hypothetical protein